MLEFFNKNPQFLQAKLDSKISPIFRYFLIICFYSITLFCFLFLKSGLAEIFLGLFLFMVIIEIYFFNRKNATIKPPDKEAILINYDLAKIFIKNNDYSLQSIFVSLLSDKKIKYLLEKLDLNPDILKNQIRFSAESLTIENLKNLLNLSFINAQKRGDYFIKPQDLFFEIVKDNPDFIKILGDCFLSFSDVKLLLCWDQNEDNFKKFSIFSLHPIGLSWVGGYTPLLDRFSTEIKKEEINNWHGFLYQDLIKQIVLSIHAGYLPVLIGHIGSGRKGLISSFIKEMYRGRLSSYLNFRRALIFKNEEFQAVFESSNEIDKMAIAAFKESIYAKNIFLIITDIEKTPQLCESLSEFIGLKNFLAIATTTLEGFEKEIQPNQKIASKCQKIIINELKNEDVLLILMDKAWHQGAKYKITLQALKKIIALSERFDQYLAEPQRSIHYLDEVLLSSLKGDDDIIRADNVEKFFAKNFKVSIGPILYPEKQKLSHIEELFHQKLVDQEEAVTKISNVLKSARLGLTESARPIATMLFLGPTGVGKTTLAKVIAKVFFESEEFLVRVDLNEYSDSGGILRLIDLSQGANSFIANIKKNSQGVLLLDEIEKAHLNVKNVLLQMLDEGYLSDSEGTKIYLNNYIIIATSNAASEFIRENISLINTTDFYHNLKELLLRKGIFTPEFLNRFDSIIAFKPLSEDDVLKLSKMLLDEFSFDIKNEKNISISFSDEFIAKIAKMGFSPEWGARELKRVIQNEVKPLIAQKIIEGNLKSGDTIKL